MTAFIDQRLMEKINEAGESGLIEALIVVAEPTGSFPGDADGGLARKVVEGVAESKGEPPDAVHDFPRANAAVIRACGRLLKALPEDERLRVASATETGVDTLPDL